MASLIPISMDLLRPTTSGVLYTVLSTLILTVIVKKIIEYFRPPPKREGKEIPWVSGCLPYVGHGLTFGKDMAGFMRRAQEKYGTIFKIKIFRIKMVVLCDRMYASEFFAAKEEEMSLYGMLERLYFDDAFACERLPFRKMVEIMIRKGIAVNGAKLEDILPKMEIEAKLLVKRLEASQKKSCDLRSEMIDFVANTSARVFLGTPMTREGFAYQLKFNQLLNHIIISTYFLPRWLIRALYHKKLVALREQVARTMFPEIKKYRDDPNKDDSYILRAAVDYVNEETGETLTDLEIGAIIVCILYVSSENTALALTNVLADLTLHPEHWEKAKQEAHKYVNELNDFKGLVNSKYLHACIMESARHHSHVFAVSRKPSHTAYIHDHYVGDVDTLAMCELLLHFEGDAAGKVFYNPKLYNPERFLKKDGKLGEPFGPTSIMTWGAGIHHCAGKMFAFFEIKMAMAQVLLNLQMDLDHSEISKPGYFSPSGIADRHVRAVFTATPSALKESSESAEMEQRATG